MTWYTAIVVLGPLSVMALFVISIRFFIDLAWIEPDLIIKDDGVYYDIDEKRKYI